MVKLGIIGLSEGNGHPYSWSAIINGYDPVLMEDCGFPVIPAYLALRNFPDDSISNAQVTHVWTEDVNLSRHIAMAANIGTVVENFVDLIGAVDAVLLARDDSENHAFYALPFLKAGIPIYIDKPLSCKLEDAKKLLSYQIFPGQIFTGSALKYAKELQLSLEQVDNLGDIHFISAVVPKEWDKYAIHLIDPIIQFPIERGPITWSAVNRVGPVTNLTVRYSKGMTLSLNTVGESATPIKISVYGNKSDLELVFVDTFSAFRSALQSFINSVITKNHIEDTASILEAVNLIELGRLNDD